MLCPFFGRIDFGGQKTPTPDGLSSTGRHASAEINPQPTWNQHGFLLLVPVPKVKLHIGLLIIHAFDVPEREFGANY